jgi:hypothetical protein
MEISSASIVEGFIQSSSRCENFLEITCVSSFVISLLFRLTHTRCAESAAAQQKFWQMHDELFTHQTALEDRDLSRYARRVGLNLERFTHGMTEHSFLQQIESDYQLSLFDEHVTGTPTLYLNDVRYTGPTDLDGFLHAIKLSDTQDRIQLPEHGLRSLLSHLRRGAND